MLGLVFCPVASDDQNCSLMMAVPVFAVYQGITRTDPSDPFTYMEYSVDNENLIGVTTLESIANYKNHFTEHLEVIMGGPR